jgi:hypothetical protein
MLQTGLAIAFLPTAMPRPLDGTLVEFEPDQLMVNADRQFQTFTMAKKAIVDRQSRVACDARGTTSRIKTL